MKNEQSSWLCHSIVWEWHPRITERLESCIKIAWNGTSHRKFWVSGEFFKQYTKSKTLLAQEASLLAGKTDVDS